MESTTIPVQQPDVPASEDKTVAILSYVTLIGFIVAILIHQNKKTKLGAYHLRQMLGLILTQIVGGMIFVIPLLGWVIAPLIFLFVFVLWIIGLISAINGQQKPTPILGPMYQKWFGTAFD